MRRSISTMFALATLLLLCGRPFAQEQTTTTEEVPPDAAPITTAEVVGKVAVDLRGVWLLVTQGQVGTVEGKVRNGADLYAVWGDDGKQEVELYLRELPEAMATTLKESNKKLLPWKPTDDDIASLSKNLESLTPIDPMRFEKHIVKLVGPDSYESTFKADVQDMLKDTQFGLDLEHQFRPQPVKDKMAQLMLDKALMGGKQINPNLYEGRQIRTLLAAGFAPIAVTTKGPFWLYRVRGPENMPSRDGAASGSWLSRLFSGLTRGCK
jgi:hypothetical protein